MHKLHFIPALTDNYIWILENEKHQAIIIDPAESKSVITYLTEHEITPIAIMLTHHHDDHIGGVPILQTHYPTLSVYGPSEISLVSQAISEQSELNINGFHFDIISVPGHTLEHLAYYCKPYLFCGDTLFSGGCGRIFEGTAEQMFASLNKLKMLPDDTQICAGHEYTKSNLQFAHKIVPDDQTISHYRAHVDKKTVTLPSLLANEKKMNLFLRCHEKQLQNKLGFTNEFALFTFLRKQKDIF